MKILIFSWRDIKHPNSGGAEILTLELAKRWIKKGHQVSLISARFPNAKSEETIEKLKIFRPAKFYSQSPFEYVSYLYKTAKFYQKELSGKYDIIIDQVHGLPFFTPFFVKEKVILFPLEVASSIWFYEIRFPFSLIGFILEYLSIKIFRNIPFLTISHSTASDLKRLGGKNIFTILPGFSFKPQKRVPRKTKYPLLVSLGRITPMKRIGDTLQTFRLLHKEFPIVKLIVIGRGREKYIENLKNLCQSIGVDDRVSFVGFVSEEEKKEILSSAWALISTSLKEGWGLNVIEAAACGTPTVAYKVSGLIDSVKNWQTGILCSKNNPVELGRNLRKLLIDHRFRKNLSKNALNYSRNFSWNKAAEEGMEILTAS